MADDLKRLFNAEVTLVKGSGGVFEVTLDGKLLFSKKQLGRHAAPNEVVDLVKKNLPNR